MNWHRNIERIVLAAAATLALSAHTSAEMPRQKLAPIQLSQPDAYEYLVEIMDQYHRVFYVYDDFGSPGNHFDQRARICHPDFEYCLPAMNEACTEQPYSGTTCIECHYAADKGSWGGWSFLCGYLGSNDVCASVNWGNHPYAAHDLRGSSHLTFRARGKNGGEKVQFSCLGIGRTKHGVKPGIAYPGSASQTATKYITLTPEWRKYTIDLSECDLEHAICGFAWQTKATVNRFKDITFYIDDIHFDKERLNEPRLLTSYETLPLEDDFDTVMANTAYVYDNALAVSAFLAANDKERALLVADALLLAMYHDRYYADQPWLRNAYQGGDLQAPPGYQPNGHFATARLPGYWNIHESEWTEDAMAAGTHAGNVAWTMLAFLNCYEQCGGGQYLNAAMDLGDWIEQHCFDTRGRGGYTAGYEGWEPEPRKLLYKSTEHNLDLYVAFQRLFLLTGDRTWQERARHAKTFFLAMWDNTEGKFWTGTFEDGVSISTDVIPVDAQAWAIMALREECPTYRKCLDFADRHLRVGAGFDFNQDGDGIWYEGTAQMALAYAICGDDTLFKRILACLEASQSPLHGGMPATDGEPITTGFHLNSGTPWLYLPRYHIGATAWKYLAEKKANPFWMNASSTRLFTSAENQQIRW